MITLGAESASTAAIDSAGERSVVRHSHYYDAALHRAITETGGVDGRRTLERAAASAAFRAIAGDRRGDPAQELTSLLEATGLGAVQRCVVTSDRAELDVAPSEFVRARLEMFGKATAPTCDVSRGVIAGALGAHYGGDYSVREIGCVALGDAVCHFEATAETAGSEASSLLPFEWPAASFGAPVEPLPDTGPLGELTRGPTAASYGLSHGRLWTELYARASYDFEEAIPREMGAKFSNLASVVLTEAAHLGTFYGVGGLVRSEEWRERVVPVLPSREEWIHAIVSLGESFGWGMWRVRLLAPEQRFTVHVHDGYEALAYLALNGEEASSPRCYFSRGFVGGLMNVLFGGDVIAPPALNQGVYNSLFRSPSSFRAIETRCQAMGHPYCEFVANPLSPGLRRS